MAGMSYRAVDVFTPQEFEDVALDPGPPVSIRSLKAAAKRRKRVWLFTAFAGLIIGASLHLLLPAKVTAVSRLYLVEPAGTDPTIAMTNEVSLLGTQTVGEAAMGILHLSPARAIFPYRGLGDGSSILTIRATGPNAVDAVARVDAVAKAFLKVRSLLEEKATTNEIAALRAEVRSLQADRRRPGSGNTGQQRAAADTGQITTLLGVIAQDQQNQSAAIRDSVVLDAGYVPPVSAKKAAVKDALSGLVAGLALGLTIVIIGELLSDRLRARSDVAAALGAPVELSVGRLA